MVKKFLFGISLLICFYMITSVAWAQEVIGPKMVIEEKSFDFKEVEQGRVIEHDFRVLNKGDQPLEIRKVKPG